MEIGNQSTRCCHKMSNGCTRILCLLLDLIQFFLKTLWSVTNSFFILFQAIVGSLVYALNMTESPKKRKRNSDKSNQTTSVRGVINANWQAFLSNNLNMDKQKDKPPQQNNADQYTGTFRRARKKKADITSNSVQNNMKTLNLTPKPNETASNTPVNDNKKDKKSTKFVAMDCEMVGIGSGGNDHMLARVSLVNKFGDCIYDKFVKAREEVTDYRTSVSGVRREDLLNGTDFATVQKDVAELLRGKVLVGHSLKNDLSVLFLSHPKRKIRDTSRYKPFRKITKGSTPSLKRLAKEILGIDIQHGEHSSVEDARAAMQLYCTQAKTWEAGLCDKRGHTRIVDE